MEARQVLTENDDPRRDNAEAPGASNRGSASHILLMATSGKCLRDEVSMLYYGMHAYWWVFWIFLWLMYFSWFMPIRRTTYRLLQTPLQILQARYAAGDVTSEDYEERRAKLLRDANTK